MRSVAGGGCFGGVMEFGMSRRIKPNKICRHFNEGNLTQFGRSVKINSGAT